MSGHLRWRESMRGRVAFGATDFNQGWWTGGECAVALELERDHPDVPARARGHVDCPALGGRLAIEDGTFEVLEEIDPAHPRHRQMRYRLALRDGAGRPLRLVGIKEVQDDAFRDAWPDTTTLFTRIYAGDELLAMGILRLSLLAFLRQLTSFRGPLREQLAFGWMFTRRLLDVYVGPRSKAGQEAFPFEAEEPGPQWTTVRDGLRRRVLAVRTADGVDLTLHHLARPGREPGGDPVLLMHGTGTRAEIFYGAPTATTLPEALLDAGLDVWVANWRGSIDRPAREYTLDEVARFDHPALIAAVLRATGRDTLKMVVHCQGSTSFALASAAGLVPEVTDVVSTGVSFHVDVTPGSARRMRLLLPLLTPGYPGFDPQWGIRPTALRARMLATYARLVRRECHQPVCQVANYVYGAGGNVLWAHRNLDAPTHTWIAREFGWVPTTFFRQMARCARAGQIVSVDGDAALPERAADRRPRDLPRWTLVAGGDNTCFLPSGQERTFAWLDGLEPGRHALHVLPGYTHLDLYFGTAAGRDVFPLIVSAVNSGTSPPTAR